jgi:hypothetical protein
MYLSAGLLGWGGTDHCQLAVYPSWHGADEQQVEGNIRE